jgi:dephospho-CoA kinase
VFTIGLTGGIASGKSTVAALFSALGVPVIDTDQLAREVVMPGELALNELIAAFGPGILDTAGHLDRKALRRRVFAHPAERMQLEAILHPAIRARLAAQLAALTSPYAVIAMPLLAETHQQASFDRVLVVDCPESLQMERLLARDGETKEGAKAILAAQATRHERLQLAHDVIENSTSQTALGPQVEALHHRYLALAHSGSA